MDTKKNKIAAKCEQVLTILQVMDDLAKTGDNVVSEMSSAAKLIRSLTTDVASLVDQKV